MRILYRSITIYRLEPVSIYFYNRTGATFRGLGASVSHGVAIPGQLQSVHSALRAKFYVALNTRNAL